MLIEQIIQLPNGVSGLTFDGTVGYCGTPKHLTGEKNGKPYDFWSQFITVTDGSGEIGVNLGLNSQADSVSKGQKISVEKGKIDSYTKDGETKKSVRGKLAANSTFPANVTTPPQAHSGKVEQEIKTRSVCLSYALEHLGLKLPYAYDAAEEMVNYVMWGKVPTPINDPPQGAPLPPDENVNVNPDDF